jgi:hypothetical protein
MTGGAGGELSGGAMAGGEQFTVVQLKQAVPATI